MKESDKGTYILGAPCLFKHEGNSFRWIPYRYSGVTPEGFWDNKYLVVTTLMKSSTTGHWVPLPLEDLLYCVHSWENDYIYTWDGSDQVSLTSR